MVSRGTGVRSIDIGPREVRQQEPRNPRAASCDQGNGWCITEQGRDVLLASQRASSSTWAIAAACTRAASSSVAGPSVAVLSPGGLTAPASEICSVSSAGRVNRSFQLGNRLECERMTTGMSAGTWLITATARFMWPKPWLVT